MPRSWSEAVKACKEHPKKIGGRWCRCYGVGWRYRMGLPDPVTGRMGRPEWSPSFPTKEAADRHQRETRQAIAEHTYTRDRGATVERWLIQWLDAKERAGRKPSTISGYRSVVEGHLIPHLGQHRVGELRVDHVQAMLDRIASTPSIRVGTERAPTASTLLNIRGVLRTALSDAERLQMVERNVAKLAVIPSVRRPAPVQVSPDRLSRFLAYVTGDALEVLWTIDVIYGMRRAELCGLRWEDVDAQAGILRVCHALVEVEGLHACPYCPGKHRRLLFGTVKSRAGERVYPLIPDVAGLLEEQRRRQDADRVLFGADYLDHGLVFARPDGNPWRPAWVSARFKKLVEASGAADGLKAVPSVKALRSTATSNLFELGVPIEVVSALTGHADSEVTRNHYLTVSADRVRAEYTAIAARLAVGRSDRQSDQNSHHADLEAGGGAEK